MEVWINNYSRRWKNISPIKENDLCSLAFDFDMIKDVHIQSLQKYMRYINFNCWMKDILGWRCFY